MGGPVGRVPLGPRSKVAVVAVARQTEEVQPELSVATGRIGMLPHANEAFLQRLAEERELRLRKSQSARTRMSEWSWGDEEEGRGEGRSVK